MIGPLFVASGVSAFDVVVGLLVGNLLAVLSWIFLTAPIATRARLTLYYQLEKICGRQPGDALQPGQRRHVLLPGRRHDHRLGHGGRRLVRVPDAGAERRLPQQRRLGHRCAGRGRAHHRRGGLRLRRRWRRSPTSPRRGWCSSSWRSGWSGLQRDRAWTPFAGVLALAAKDVIWKGGAPLAGQVKFTFWHVMFFAWFCNMAMHIGMADLSVFRYARKSWYGVSSAGGHVPRPLHGLARGIHPLRRAAPRQPREHGRPPRPAGLPRLRRCRPVVRDRRRVDHRQPDDLPRGPRLPGDRPAIVALSRHAADRAPSPPSPACFPASPCGCSTSSPCTAWC